MKKAIIGLLIGFVTLSTAACSSSPSSSSSPSPSASSDGSSSPSPSTSEPAATAAPKEVKLTIGLPASYDRTKKEIIDGFEAKFPYIKVTVQDPPWGDFATKIATQIAGGNPPDVWFQENPTILGYGERGVAEDLAPYIARDLNPEDFVDALYSAKTADGKIWGVPHGVNPVALAYNKTMFTAANVPFPMDDWTFQDLIDTAKKLTTGTKDKPDVVGFVGTPGITQGWFPWIKQAGGQALDASKTKSMFSDPKTIAGLTEWSNGVKEGYISNTDFSKANGGEIQTFAAGKGAMYLFQYSGGVTMNENFPDVDWDVVKVPKSVDGKRIVPMVANTWMIYSKSKQEVKDAAWEFLKYYLGDEAQTIVAGSGATLPVRKTALASLDTSTTKPLNKKAFTEGIAEGGTTLDENPSWNEWRGVAQPIINDIFNGIVPVDEGVKQIDEKVQAVLDQYK